MKIEYGLIKAVLEEIEKQSDGQNLMQVVANEIQGEYSQEQVDYHLCILEDDALIDVATRLNGVVGSTMINRLTAEGHRVLEAMQNDTFLEKLKSGVLGAGKEVLKQVPNTFIKMILSSSVL